MGLLFGAHAMTDDDDECERQPFGSRCYVAVVSNAVCADDPAMSLVPICDFVASELPEEPRIFQRRAQDVRKTSRKY